MIDRIGLMSKLVVAHGEQDLAGSEVFLIYLGQMAVNVFTNLFLGSRDKPEIHAIAHESSQRADGK